MRWPLGRYATVGLAGAGAALLVGGVALAVRVSDAPADQVPAGVRVGTVDVGGLSVAEAEAALRARAHEFTPQGRVVLVSPAEPGFRMSVPAASLKPRPRLRLAAREAAQSQSVGNRFLAAVGLPRERVVDTRFRVTEGGLRAVVGRARTQLARSPREATVRLKGSAFTVVRSRPGRRVQRDRLRAQLRHLPERIDVAVVAVPPRVTTARARAARRRALRLSDRPVVVTARGLRARMSAATLREAVRFEPRGRRLAVGLDADAVAAAIGPTLAPLAAEPREARLQVVGGQVRIEPSQTGRSIDAAATAQRIAARPDATRVRARVVTQQPALTTDGARKLRVRELVSEFTTPYSCCPPRVTNIRRAAEILDGTIIPAGGRFSLNETLGQRTRARGFVPAPQINAGKLEDAVGGGVSQIATTVFNAAFFAGLQLESHTPHEFYISRYPAGREATVSWGGPELVFVNDWPAGILMKAQATDSGISVQLYSSKLGRRVTTETSPNPGAGAFEVSYTRKVSDGGELKRDERWSWTYKAAPAA